MPSLAHKIEFTPSKAQESLLKQAVGVSRSTYNWALESWNTAHENYTINPFFFPKPTMKAIKAEWEAIKYTLRPWVKDSPSNANQQPFRNLDEAFHRFFLGKSGHPTFKKKGVRDSFYVDNQKLKIFGLEAHLPKIGKVKLTEKLRFKGKILNGTVSTTAGRWFLSINVELPKEYTREKEKSPEAQGRVIGVDLGIEKLATLSTGEVIENPRFLQRKMKKLARLQRRHARKVEGSKNSKKSAKKVAKLHWRVANQRRDLWHKLTTQLHRENQVAVIETLGIKGMVKNRRLSRAISDAGWGEFRRQLGYKAPLFGNWVILADRWFPSSKLCSRCGVIHAHLTLADRVFRCDACGLVMDRDLNAAINLEALGTREVACGGAVRPRGFVSSDASLEAATEEAGKIRTRVRIR